MGPNRRHDSGHFPRQASFLPLTVGLIGCVRKAISRANEDTWGEPGQAFCNRTRINGSALFLAQATATTEQNCEKHSKPSPRKRQRLAFASPNSSPLPMARLETKAPL